MKPEFVKAAAILRESRNWVFLTGAGVSAESGVPTFRGQAGEPVWKEHWDASELSNPRFLRKDPAAFWEWMQYRRKIIEMCLPNAAHEVLGRFEKAQGEKFKLITTNVDGLHEKAGSKSLIELHGNIWRVRCTRCVYRSPYLGTDLSILPPKCPTCGQALRPDLVLFEENLVTVDLEQAFHKCNKTDVLVVIGSSNLVRPASDLPFRAYHAGAKVISINPASTNIDQISHVTINEKAAIALPIIEKLLNGE